MELRLTGNPGSAYLVQASQDLKTWESMLEVQAGPDGAIRFTDAVASKVRMKFYRLVPAQSENAPESSDTPKR